MKRFIAISKIKLILLLIKVLSEDQQLRVISIVAMDTLLKNKGFELEIKLSGMKNKTNKSKYTLHQTYKIIKEDE